MNRNANRERIITHILSLPVGTEFTASSLAKEYNKTSREVGDYIKDRVGVIIVKKSNHHSGKGIIYVRI